jgi:hypothetical protein
VSVYSFTGGLLTKIVAKNTDGTTVLDTMTYCYDSTISACNSTPPTQHPTWLRAYHTVPGVSTNAEIDTKVDSHGNVVEVDRYDFGPTLLSKALIQFGTWNGSSCVNLSNSHISGVPCDIQVQNASSSVQAHTRFAYNGSTGDLLNSYVYTDATHYLTTTNTYNSNGTLASTTGPDGIQIIFGNSPCNGLLADHQTSPIGTVNSTWDCNTALLLTTTDLNGLVTTNTYADPLLRITQVSYSGGSAPTVFTYPLFTRVSKHITFNSNASIADTTTTLNSLGQTLSVQHQASPGSPNYDTVSFTYDSVGRQASMSVACTTTLGATCATHAVEYTYDGLGRVKTKTVKTSTPGVSTYSYPAGDTNIVLTPAPTGENSKIVQIETDGLGRTASVCSVVTSGLSGTGACGQRSAATGYLKKYSLDALGRATQVSQNAQSGSIPVNSGYTYDQIGRVTQRSLPESGTANFYYDGVGPDCSSFPSSYTGGKLTETKDAAGNVTCNTFETGAGRLSSVYYPSGPNAVNSRAAFFVYDIASPLLGSGTNLVGRMSAAGTCQTGSSCAGSALTIRALGYDLFGRIKDLWQKSPNANSFHTTATYFDNGTLASLGGIPGVSDFTYTIDGEGRHYSATSGATAIVSSTSYDAGSHRTAIAYANGDADSYQWDNASQNMTQYKFTIGAGATTDTGTLTWNPNNTLQKLAVIDNLSSLDTGTCTTAHDDLARITSWNCGALFSETYSFSPDYAGNVTKSGSFNFAPGYTASNNHMLAPYTYDMNGSLLHDANLTLDYSWNSSGRMTSFSGASIVNDAFGMMVENTVSGVTTLYPYSPAGKLGSASSLTSKLSLKIPLPAGSSITYDSAGNQRINHKDFRESTVLTTNRIARTVGEVFCYGPMGEIYCGAQANSLFENSFQDTISGLDDFDVTKYSGAQGRWISPISEENAYVKTNSPF